MPYFIYIVFSFWYVLLSFLNLRRDQFFFIHDQYLPLSNHDYQEIFSLVSSTNLGSRNGISVLLTFWDRIFYLLTHNIGLNLKQQEFVIFFFCFASILCAGHYGFTQISRYFQIKPTNHILVALTFLYCFNIFTVILWNTGTMSLTTAITYALSPLFFYYSAIYFNSLNIKNKYLYRLILIIGLSIFSLPLFLASSISIFLFLIINANRGLFSNIKGKMFKFVLALPLVSIMPLYVVINDVISAKGTTNANPIDAGTYSLLKGGLLYQLLNLSSFATYTDWQFKNILNFGNYFLSPLVYIPTILLIIYIVYLFTTNNYTRKLYVILLTFLLVLFIKKGDQPPLSNIYLFLISKVPLFSVFRSPDSKFALPFILLLILVCLLSYAYANKFQKKILFILIVVFGLIQSYPFLLGQVLYGVKSDQSSTRNIHITPEIYNLIAYVNHNTNENDPVLAIPALNYNIYKIDGVIWHNGQDLIGKLINNPVIYLESTSPLSKKIFESLNGAILNSFSGNNPSIIKYILIRDDIINNQDISNIEKQANLELIYKNKFYKLFRIRFKYELFTNVQAFKRIFPFLFELESQSKQELTYIYFNYSYNKNWILINKKSRQHYLPFINTQFDTIKYGVNKIESSNSSFYLVYLAQIIFIFTLIIHIISLVTLAISILLLKTNSDDDAH